ncbi:MAG: enoyl-CoA hydratase/isomerase family protein [Cellvibrionaceae bacterium]|nr:enoyl-CoA hydratase/isomerase family protein [Cellvibrionaceae bacterium]
MKSNFIQCDLVQGVAVLELDDPSANTLTYHMLRELENRFLMLEQNTEVKAVFFTGKGEKFFSGGVNIGMLLTAGKKHNSHFILYAVELLDYIQHAELPIITAINGSITGGGLELALIADYRLAVAGDYNIGFPEIRLGVIPGMGGTQRLSRLIGADRAFEIIANGEFINSDKAKKIGLVDEILPVDNFKHKAVSFALEKIKNNERQQGIKPKIMTDFSMVDAELITCEIKEGIGTVYLTSKTLSSPAIEVLKALNEALLLLRADEDVNTIIIDSCQGSVLGDHNAQINKQFKRYFTLLLSRIDGYPRIFTYIGSGVSSDLDFALCMACDYHFIHDRTSNNELRQTIACDLYPVDRYQQTLGKKINKQQQSILLSDLIDMGFYRVVDYTNYKAAVKSWVSRFVPPYGASQAIGYAKLAITRGFGESISAGLLLERHLQEQLFTGKDGHEGMSAYIEKRTPMFVGE